MTLGQVLTQRRAKLGLSIDEVADRLGVKPRVVSRWERDEDRPRPGRVGDVAEALELDPADLLAVTSAGTAAPASHYAQPRDP